MTWLDGVCILLVLLIASVASWQGTVRGGVTLFGFYFGGKLSQFLAERLAASANWFALPELNKAAVFAIALLLLSSITLVAAYYASEIAQFSLEESDHLVALPIGILVGVTVAHWLVQLMVWMYPPNSPFHQLLASSPVAKELLTFHAIKSAIAYLFQWSRSP